MTPCPSGDSLDWSNCYSGQYDLWAPESYAHPAKMGPGLAFRILGHLEKLGLLRPGQTVLDPMCGTGTTLLAASVLGHPAVGVELEPRFVSLAQANADRLTLKGFGAPIRIMQGDARHLSTLLQERGLCAVSSPPYIDADNRGKMDKVSAGWGRHDGRYRGPILRDDYGTTPGQIGALPDHAVAVTSPPYEDSDVDGARNMPEHYFDRVGGVRHRRTVATAQMGAGEDYLSAMARVYREIARCADVLAIVLKNPTRNGKLRDLTGDTIAILEANGWRIHCHHHAMLFSEQEQGHLFDGSQKQVKGRMSFFKRLSYAKGNVVADHEDVIFAVSDAT